MDKNRRPVYYLGYVLKNKHEKKIDGKSVEVERKREIEGKGGRERKRDVCVRKTVKLQSHW